MKLLLKKSERKQRFYNVLQVIGVFILLVLITYQKQMATIKAKFEVDEQILALKYAESFFIWFAVLICIPVLIALANRFQLREKKLWYTIPIHTLFSLVFIVVHTDIFQLLLTTYTGTGYELQQFWDAIDWHFSKFGSLSPIIYWMVIIITNIVVYRREYREKLINEVQVYKSRQSSKLQLLKMQLKPHFIFNAVNSISSLIMTDVEASKKVIHGLKELLNHNAVQSDEQLLTLEKELEITHSYLSIEKVRFSDRLMIEYDIDAQSKEIEVPSLILQPIVENAIKHGLTKCSGPFYLKIKTNLSKDASLLKICIEDSGPGLDQTIPKIPSKGIGLRNSRERLRLLYPNSSFEMKQSELGGVKVCLCILLNKHNLNTNVQQPTILP